MGEEFCDHESGGFMRFWQLVMTGDANYENLLMCHIKF